MKNEKRNTTATERPEVRLGAALDEMIAEAKRQHEQIAASAKQFARDGVVVERMRTREQIVSEHDRERIAGRHGITMREPRRAVLSIEASGASSRRSVQGLHATCPICDGKGWRAPGADECEPCSLCNVTGSVWDEGSVAILEFLRDALVTPAKDKPGAKAVA